MRDDLGTITACYTITFERHSKHSADRLWRSLTDPDEVSVWMEAPAKIDLRVGGDWYIDFSAHHKGGEGQALDGIIFKVEPERVLGYVWGTSVVQWTIEAHEDGCSYTFIHTGLAGGREDEEGLAAGWHGFLDQLEAHLDDRSISREDGEEQWSSLKPNYREQLDRVFALRTPD